MEGRGGVCVCVLGVVVIPATSPESVLAKKEDLALDTPAHGRAEIRVPRSLSPRSGSGWLCLSCSDSFSSQPSLRPPPLPRLCVQAENSISSKWEQGAAGVARMPQGCQLS